MSARRDPNVPCSVDGCTRTGQLTRGMCGLHYHRWYRTGDAGEAESRYGGQGVHESLGRTCSVEGCDEQHDAQGLCKVHYLRMSRLGTLELPPRVYKHSECTVDGCSRRACRGDVCRLHEPPKTHSPRKFGSKVNPYIALYSPDHPNAMPSNGYVMEHILVFTEWLGRPLYSGENIHHRNGVRWDNRLENLELWVISQPAGQRPADLLVWAREILDRYEDYCGPSEE